MQKKVVFFYIHIRSLKISHLFYLKVIKASFQIMVKTEFSQLHLLLVTPQKILNQGQCHVMERKHDKERWSGKQWL